RRPGVLEEVVQVVLHIGLRPQHHAAEAAALAVDVLGGGVDHDIGAELQGLLQHRGGEHVVDHDDGAGGVGDLGDGGDVDQVEGGVGRRLEEEGLRVGPYRVSPSSGVAAVDYC